MALAFLRTCMFALAGLLAAGTTLAQTAPPPSAKSLKPEEVAAKLDALLKQMAAITNEVNELKNGLAGTEDKPAEASPSDAAVQGKSKAAPAKNPQQKSAVQKSNVQAPHTVAPAGGNAPADNKSSEAAKENKPADSKANEKQSITPLQNTGTGALSSDSATRLALTEPTDASTTVEPVNAASIEEAAVEEDEQPAADTAAAKADPKDKKAEITDLVSKHLMEKVSAGDAKFKEHGMELARVLAQVVNNQRKFPPASGDVVRQDAKLQFSEWLKPLPTQEQEAWTAAQREFETEVEKRYKTATAANWIDIYEATSQGLLLDAAKRKEDEGKVADTVAKDVAGGFWSQSAKEYGTDYWDERFDESATKLADRMEAVADNSSLTTTGAIHKELADQFNAFQVEINNELVPEKTAAWLKLATAWHNRLVAARLGGTLDGASPEALRVAIREAAKDLRQAGTDWQKKRVEGVKNQTGPSRGSQGGGSGGGAFYGTPHHARKVQRIYGRHSVRMARIQGITGGR